MDCLSGLSRKTSFLMGDVLCLRKELKFWSPDCVAGPSRPILGGDDPYGTDTEYGELVWRTAPDCCVLWRRSSAKVVLCVDCAGVVGKDDGAECKLKPSEPSRSPMRPELS